MGDLKGKLLREFPSLKVPVFSVNFSPDGQKIAFGSQNGIFVDNLDGKQLNYFPNANRLSVSLRFSPDSKFILCPGKNYRVEIRSLDGKLISVLQGHKAQLYLANFNTNGKLLATASQDKDVKIWNHNGTLLKTLPHDKPVTQVAFYSDDNLLISGTEDGTINL